VPDAGLSPTSRFSDRADDYVRHRPGYPDGVFTFIAECSGLDVGWRVADVGSGTGKLAEGFLRFGCTVTGIEPNDAMRAAGDREMAGFERFTSIGGTAEETGLPAASFDLAAAGQALHWFDLDATRREFLRILRPPAWVTVVWNERLADATPFLIGYEALLNAHCPEYARVDHRRIGRGELEGFYGHADLAQTRFDNLQRFGWEGLWGRVISSSYVPREGPAHDALHDGLHALFEACAEQGEVAFLYETQVTVAPMKGSA
jgi:SAM-dependent methyltransferase